VNSLSGLKTVNKQNNGGFTALHLSCQAGHNQSTRELLIAGADPNLVNTYGDTPLHTAVRYGHAGVARILLSARAAPDVQNKVHIHKRIDLRQPTNVRSPFRQ
jgi:ankyrin repeat protein